MPDNILQQSAVTEIQAQADTQSIDLNLLTKQIRSMYVEKVKA